ncbi:MAG TPA: hypothetical protein PKD84_10910 [Propionicimonas sp.]|nr:hypothetical protein [Propionicimonas sp.]
MTGSPTEPRQHRTVIVMLIVGATVAITLIALTIATQMSRGQTWLPGLIAPLITGAAAGGITYVVRRSTSSPADRTRIVRWAIAVALAGVVLMGAAIGLISAYA